MKGVNIEENIKNKVIDLITQGSEDRLIIFKPEGDKNSLDLVVKKRGEYKSGAALSFQISIFIGPSKTDIIIKDFLANNLIPDEDFYLMFVYFDGIKQDVSNIWIVPSPVFSEMAESQKSENGKMMLRFETTIISDKEDKYSKFLVDKKNLGNFLLELIQAKE